MTAVDWIILQLKKEKETLKNHFEEGKWNDDRCSEIDNCLLICEQAKQMEKEGIIEFAEEYNMYLLKCKKGIRGSVVEMSAEQYYNEIYGKK